MDGFSGNVRLVDSLKICREIQVPLQTEKNGSLLIKTCVHYGDMSLSAAGSDNVSDNSCRENQNRHFVFNTFFFENRTV